MNWIKSILQKINSIGLFHKNTTFDMKHKRMNFPNAEPLSAYVKYCSSNSDDVFKLINEMTLLIQDCSWKSKWLFDIVFIVVLKYEQCCYFDDLKLHDLIEHYLSLIYDVSIQTYSEIEPGLAELVKPKNLKKLAKYAEIFIEIMEMDPYDESSYANIYDDKYVTFVNKNRIYEFVANEYVNVDERYENAVEMNVFESIDKDCEYVIFNIFSGHLFRVEHQLYFEDGGRFVES